MLQYFKEKKNTVNLSFLPSLKQTYGLLPGKLYIVIKEMIRHFGIYKMEEVIRSGDPKLRGDPSGKVRVREIR